MLVVYYGFILLVAFNKPLPGAAARRRRHDAGHPDRRRRHRLHHLITGLYVQRANSEFDDLTDADRQGGAEMSGFTTLDGRCAARLTLATLFGVSRRLRRPAPTSARRPSRPPTGRRSACSALFVVVHAVHHQVGGGQDQERGRLLHRRRRHHRLPERPGDRRRLHVGGLLPGHLGGGDGQRLRRPDLLDRLPGRLAGHHLPDGRAAAQPGQVHLCRRGRLPLRARRRSASSRPPARWWWWPST